VLVKKKEGKGFIWQRILVF